MLLQLNCVLSLLLKLYIPPQQFLDKMNKQYTNYNQDIYPSCYQCVLAKQYFSTILYQSIQIWIWGFDKPNTALSLFEHWWVRAVIGNAFGIHLSINNCADSNSFMVCCLRLPGRLVKAKCWMGGHWLTIHGPLFNFPSFVINCFALYPAKYKW